MTRYAFWEVGGGSHDSILWVGVYGGHSDEWWHKAIIKPVYRVAHRLDRLIWAARYRLSPRHRYHLVDTRLEPGYYDVDYLMLHACFALLRRYIEDEMGGEEAIRRFNQQLLLVPDPNAPEGLQERQADRQANAVDLYLWWTKTKPADEAERERMCSHLYGRQYSVKKDADGRSVFSADTPWTDADRAMHKQFRALERKIEREERTMLHQLIEIRGSLWT